jgi:hypothetical protein
MFKPLSLLICSVLLAFPTGIGKVNALDVQSDNVRVNIDRDGGIRVESADGGTLTMPAHPTTLPDLSGWSTQPAPIDRARLDPSYPWTSDRTPTFNLPQLSQMRCSSSGYSQEISHSNQSGTGVSQSYSSTTTSVCH